MFKKKFHSRSGTWAYYYDTPLPVGVSEEEVEKNMKSFTLKDVKAWVEKHDGITGALRWFEAYVPNNAFYQKIAKPLMSIRTTGSIDVERAVKPIKGCVLTKERNRVSDGKAIVLFRLSENLKQLHKFKTEFKKQGNSSDMVMVTRDDKHVLDLMEENSSGSDESDASVSDN